VKRTDPVSPFLRASADSVEAGPWTLAGGGELDDRVNHWDPLLDLHLEREITVDVDKLLTSTAATEAGAIVAATLWRSERTRIKGPGGSVSLGVDNGAATLSLMLDVPGTSAGGNLELQTILMLTNDAPSRSPIGAHRAGSVLWSDREIVALEGDASRFPMTVVDFGALTGISDNAPWSLEWYPADLDQPVLGAMRLLINSRNEIAVDAARGAKVPESAAVASVIRFDVARALIFGALGNQDFLDSPGEFQPDTVGRMLAELLDHYWPGVEPKALAARLAGSPHGLEAEIQTAMGLLA
jgi:hypothetical protein